MVPTFTCGLDRSNFSLAMSQEPRALVCLRSTVFYCCTIAAFRGHGTVTCHPQPAYSVGRRVKDGADDQNRTGDLVLTKDALCQLSYIGLRQALASLAARP